MSSTVPPGAETDEAFEADTWDIPDLGADVDPPAQAPRVPLPARAAPPLPVQRGIPAAGAPLPAGTTPAGTTQPGGAVPKPGESTARAAAAAPSSAKVVQPPPLPRQRRATGSSPSATDAPGVPRLSGETRPPQPAPSPGKEWSRLNPGSGSRRANVEQAAPRPIEPKPTEPTSAASASSGRSAQQAAAGAGSTTTAGYAAPASGSGPAKVSDTERPKGMAVPPPATLASPEPVAVARAVPPSRTLLMPSIKVEPAAPAAEDEGETWDVDPDSTQVVAVPPSTEVKARPPSPPRVAQAAPPVSEPRSAPSAKAVPAPATPAVEAPKPQPPPLPEAKAEAPKPQPPPLPEAKAEAPKPQPAPSAQEAKAVEAPTAPPAPPVRAARAIEAPTAPPAPKVAETKVAEAKPVEAAPPDAGWLAPILEPGTSLDEIERREAAVLFDFDSDLLPGAGEQHRNLGGQSGESICTFWLGPDCFGLDVQLVNEVLLIDDILPVPWAPPGLLGLFNSRGRIVPVVDLATLLGLPPSPEASGAAQASPAILIKADSLLAAAIIDRPGLVVQVARGALTPTDGGSDEAWVKGHLRPDERSHPAVTLLDPECLVQRFLDMSRFPDIRACLGSAGHRPARTPSTKNSGGEI
jgi:chemotaxis signal transduction protein